MSEACHTVATCTAVTAWGVRLGNIRVTWRPRSYLRRDAVLYVLNLFDYLLVSPPLTGVRCSDDGRRYLALLPKLVSSDPKPKAPQIITWIQEVNFSIICIYKADGSSHENLVHVVPVRL